MEKYILSSNLYSLISIAKKVLEEEEKKYGENFKSGLRYNAEYIMDALRSNEKIIIK